MEFDERLENDEYNPVPPNYYYYKGKSDLTLDYRNELFEYCDINIFAYTINNEKKSPFQQILLAKSSNSELIFPKIPLFSNFNKNDLLLIELSLFTNFEFCIIEKFIK
jgi:hypothetical protein